MNSGLSSGQSAARLPRLRRAKRMRLPRSRRSASVRLLATVREELVDEVAVGAVDFEHVEAGLSARAARLAPAFTVVAHLVCASARGTGDSRYGDGARRDRLPGVPVVDLGLFVEAACRPPRAGRRAPCGRNGRAGCRRPRPACLMNGAAAERLDEGVVPDAEIADRAAAVRATLVDSTTTRPAPPAANLPAFIRCQSVGKPFTAEYWCIGGTTMRFFSVTPRIVIGENSIGCVIGLEVPSVARPNIAPELRVLFDHIRQGPRRPPPGGGRLERHGLSSPTPSVRCTPTSELSPMAFLVGVRLATDTPTLTRQA